MYGLQLSDADAEARLCIVQMLIEHGAPLEAENNAGESPIFFAVSAGRLDFTKLLGYEVFFCLFVCARFVALVAKNDL